MNIKRTVQIIAAFIGVLILSLLTARQPVFSSIPLPAPDVMGQSFSISDGDPLTTTGIHPADILGIGGIPLIACENLGLVCTDPVSDGRDDLRGLSFGRDFRSMGLPQLQFSVGQGSVGLPGSAVRVEVDCRTAEPQGDVFETPLDTTNFQDLDGDGTPCSGNTGYGLGITEIPGSDNVDAIAADPCQSVDLNCDGIPEEPVFFTLSPASPSLALLGASPADILMTSGRFLPVVWAWGEADLGLKPGDFIDAMCIWENTDGIYGPGDQVLISLAPGSPTLAALSASPADLLRVTPPRVFLKATKLGLDNTDNIDALLCSREINFINMYLPFLWK